ncbi:hypothetical protein [Motilibacter deserti]|uniref:DNA-binding beta-propeller fold protein YncE n=1 Tax=Motilibacter deserti TaxID=2714956 RepID=A0ABX0H0F7_9ACTN|nr:hypothetical protein [Motilibacter deserti]NHC14943.1 hypothetical protein [Motilibacter deserti]
MRGTSTSTSTSSRLARLTRLAAAAATAALLTTGLPEQASAGVARVGPPADAFATWVDAAGTVWAQRLDGSGAPRRLLDNAGPGTRALVSRDASRIVLLRAAEVLAAPAAGGPVRRVLDRSVDAAVLSPDGSTLYIAENADLGRDGVIRALDLRTGAIRAVVDPSWPVTDLDISSDGARLAYSSGVSLYAVGGLFRGQARVVDLATGADTRVGPPEADVVSVTFGPGDGVWLTAMRGDDDYYTQPFSSPPYAPYPNAGAAPEAAGELVAFGGGDGMAVEEAHFVAAAAADGRRAVPGDVDSVVVGGGSEGVYAQVAGEDDLDADLMLAPADGSAPVPLSVDTSYAAMTVNHGPLPAPLGLRASVDALYPASEEPLAGDTARVHDAGSTLSVYFKAPLRGIGFANVVLSRWQDGRWRRVGTLPVLDGQVRIRTRVTGYTTLRLQAGKERADLTLAVRNVVTLTDPVAGDRPLLRGTVVGARGGRVQVQRLVRPEQARPGRRPVPAVWRTVATAPVRNGRFALRVDAAGQAYYRVVRPADTTHDAGFSESVVL